MKHRYFTPAASRCDCRTCMSKKNSANIAFLIFAAITVCLIWWLIR